MTRDMNIRIFRDTEHMYKTHKVLKKAVNESIKNQVLILENADVAFADSKELEGKVLVSGKRTLEASEPYAKQGKRVCVLNFASATNPGGGVVHGSSAQEEAICRCSTLFPCLDRKEFWNDFYMPHRSARNPLYNDDCIFTPGVMVFKSDTSTPKLLPEVEWWKVDVITCAAPNLREVPSNIMNPGGGDKKAEISIDSLKTLWRKRINRVFEVAIANEAEVLILGAFGCGAFCNPPKLVSEVFAEYTEKYRNYFDAVEFAVYHSERETENYKAFKERLG